MAENKFIQRQYHLDYLRVFASVAIILLHVTAQNMRYVELAGTEWNIYNICNSASRWGVPVFVMISGSLFYQEKSLQKHSKKNTYPVWQ